MQPARYSTESRRFLLKLEYARKYHESLHFLFESHWYELTSADCPDRVKPELN